MGLPWFVAEYETSWTANGSPQTTSVSVQAGDVLCVVAATADEATTLNTPTGGSLTYTLAQSIVASNFCSLYAWTAPVAADATFTLSITTNGGSDPWGFNAMRFGSSDGVGASSKTNVASGAPTLDITTTEDNSAIVIVNADWLRVDGSSRVWLTNAGPVAETTYNLFTGWYSVYAGYHLPAVTAGTYTVGLSAPTGQKYSIIAVEITGQPTGVEMARGVLRKVPRAPRIRR